VPSDSVSAGVLAVADYANEIAAWHRLGLRGDSVLGDGDPLLAAGELTWSMGDGSDTAAVGVVHVCEDMPPCRDGSGKGNSPVKPHMDVYTLTGSPARTSDDVGDSCHSAAGDAAVAYSQDMTALVLAFDKDL
jgi:hypothetical protein